MSVSGSQQQSVGSEQQTGPGETRGAHEEREEAPCEDAAASPVELDPPMETILDLSCPPTASMAHAGQIERQADLRLMGAAAAMGGLAASSFGPVAAVAAAAGAAAATTREDKVGSAARKVAGTYLRFQDKISDVKLQAMDEGVKKVGEANGFVARKISRHIDLEPLPAVVRKCVENAAQPASSEADFCEEVKRLRAKHPNKVPVICLRSKLAKHLPELSKNKALLDESTPVNQVKYFIHKEIAQVLGPKAKETIYLFVKNRTPKSSTSLRDLYAQCRDNDGYLYITYSAENTLGASQ